MVKFTGGNLDESGRRALARRLDREATALRMAKQGVRLAQERRNETLRTMKAAGFTLAELSGLSGLKTAMLSRITSAKREES